MSEVLSFFFFFFGTKSLKSSVYVTLTAHFNLDTKLSPEILYLY